MKLFIMIIVLFIIFFYINMVATCKNWVTESDFFNDKFVSVGISDKFDRIESWIKEKVDICLICKQQLTCPFATSNLN